MNAIGQSGRKRTPLLWLVGGTILGVGALLARQSATKAPTASREVVRVADRSAELGVELELLRQQVSRLESQRQAPAAVGSIAQPPEVHPTTPPKIAAEPDDDPELVEVRATERAQQRIDARYAVLEQRFAAEPLESSKVAPEEQIVRQHLVELKGTELSKAECRATMCRFELKSDAPNAAEMLFRLGLTQGGTVRRSENGEFLVFAGRDGFPFHEANHTD